MWRTALGWYMDRTAESPERRQRGASEVQGAILMTALVVLTMSVAGVTLTDRMAGQSETPPLLDCEMTYEGGELLVTHAGGERVDTTSLALVLRNESGSSGRMPLVVDGGDDDGRFEVDETARSSALDARTEVLLVENRVIVCERIVYPTTATPTPGGTPTPTGNPPPTQTASPTATATTTATPTPTGTTAAPTTAATPTPTTDCPGQSCDNAGRSGGSGGTQG